MANLSEIEIGARVRVARDSMRSNMNGLTGTVIDVDSGPDAPEDLEVQVELDRTLREGRKFWYSAAELDLL